VVGGYDDFGEEGSYGFAQMNATSNAAEEAAAGREPLVIFFKKALLHHRPLAHQSLNRKCLGQLLQPAAVLWRLTGLA